MKRKNTDPIYSMCVQPSFIIGTVNEDGSDNFAPITWVSATQEDDNGYLLVISMFGTKRTKQNVIRTGIFSANLVNRDMLPLMDYLGTKKSGGIEESKVSFEVSRGEVLDVPTLDESPWVYECEVERSVETGLSTTFFARIRNIQIDERLDPKDTFDVDLKVLDPVIYSGKYHSLGDVLGDIGDFRARAAEKPVTKDDLLTSFHRKRMIMHSLTALGVFVALIGLALMGRTFAISFIGLGIVVTAGIFGFFSGAMFCPYCGEIISRQGFATHCKYCGKEIL